MDYSPTITSPGFHELEDSFDLHKCCSREFKFSFPTDVITAAGSQTNEFKGLLQFLKNADYDGFVADLSDRTSVSIEMYQVKIHTGGGHFQASLKFSRDDGSFLVKTSDISRVNKYGKQAECIENTQHQLRKFCYCK